MIIAGTGHRPDKLYGGYTSEGVEFLVKVANVALDMHQPTKVISGMALGWDTALAIAAVRKEIPLVAAVPFLGQEKKWPQKSQDIYHRLLEKAEEIVIVSEGEYSAQKLQIRNEWMVNHCDAVIALWDGSDGGTKNCIDYINSEYARSRDWGNKKVTVYNYYFQYEKDLRSLEEYKAKQKKEEFERTMKFAKPTYPTKKFNYTSSFIKKYENCNTLWEDFK